MKIRIAITSFVFIVLIITGCASAPRYVIRRPVKGNPGEFTFEKQVGVASYYGAEFHGRPTASGEIFDMDGFTCAHRTLPLGTTVRITNLENGKSIELKVNDRGPFVDGRIVDLSRGAAEKLGMIQSGTAIVKIEVVD